MQLTLFIIASLATYRVGRMVAVEDGPGDVFVSLRSRLDPDQRTWVGKGLNCVLCVAFWAALPVAILACVLGWADVWAWPIVWLGLAGAAAVIWKWEMKR